MHLITGRGAGRWPTTEAVMADLFEVQRGPLPQPVPKGEG
jgi:homoserine dehydrogenase